MSKKLVWVLRENFILNKDKEEDYKYVDGNIVCVWITEFDKQPTQEQILKASDHSIDKEPQGEFQGLRDDYDSFWSLSYYFNNEKVKQ